MSSLLRCIFQHLIYTISTLILFCTFLLEYSWFPYSQGYIWSSRWSCTVVRDELEKRQNAKQLMSSNCDAGNRLLKAPWTARRSNQSILVEINPEYSLEGLMLKLKPQYFGHLIWRVDSMKKSLMLGKIEGRRRRGCQRMWWLEDITDAMEVNLGKPQEMVRDRETWHAAVHGVTKS